MQRSVEMKDNRENILERSSEVVILKVSLIYFIKWVRKQGTKILTNLFSVTKLVRSRARV